MNFFSDSEQKVGRGKAKNLDGRKSLLENSFEKSFPTQPQELSGTDSEPAYRRLLSQLEVQFERLYEENQALYRKVEELTEQLTEQSTVTRTTTVAGTHPPSVVRSADLSDKNASLQCDENSASKLQGAVKKSGQQMANKLKNSRLVTSLFPGSASTVAGFGSSFGNQQPLLVAHLDRSFRPHMDGVWEVSSIPEVALSSSPSHPLEGFFFTASADCTAKVFSKQCGCVATYTGHNGSVNSVRINKQQPLVLTASGDCSAHIWRLSSRNAAMPVEPCDTIFKTDYDLESQNNSITDEMNPWLVQKFGGHMSPVIAADWLNNQNQIVTASWDRTAILHDVESGQVVNVLEGHEGELTNVTTHATGNLLLTSSRDQTFRLWDFRVGSKQVNVFQGHTAAVSTAVFTDQDKVVSGSDDRCCKIWDIRELSTLQSVRTRAPVNRLAVTSSLASYSSGATPNMLAITQDNRCVTLLDTRGNRLLSRLSHRRERHTRAVTSATWLRDSTSGASVVTPPLSNSGPEIDNDCCASLITADFDGNLLFWTVYATKLLVM